MTPQQFENLRDEFLTHEARILDWKRGEYAPNDDSLQNFREVATFLERRPAEVALAYLMKHIQSIALAVRTENYTWAWETEGGEGLKQRIADAVREVVYSEKEFIINMVINRATTEIVKKAMPKLLDKMMD